ncbi:MAG: hypothetical protein WC476_01630 [Phycisphaerae bacterium]
MGATFKIIDRKSFHKYYFKYLEIQHKLDTSNAHYPSKKYSRLSKKEDQMYEKAFKNIGGGDFEDSYNPYNLMFQLDHLDFTKYLDDAQNMNRENIQKFLFDVRNRNIVPMTKIVQSNFMQFLNPVAEDDDPAKWTKYFVDKKARLIKFLEKALELNALIHVSY